MPSVHAPIFMGIPTDPGGAIVAKNAGSKAVIAVPTFCAIAIAVTRVRVGNNSG